MNRQEIADKMTNIENILTGDGQEEYLKLLDEFIGLYDQLRGLHNDNTRDIIVIYEKYLDRIWGDLSKDDKIRLEGHFNGLINELGDYREELSKVTKKEKSK
tara:strand:+ start:313 stop:618 length:306 start_codon:yes stop_codon:yes gene_type:complete